MSQQSKVIISVIGYEGHDDICGVLTYLENHGVIPPYFEEFAFCTPQKDYESYSDRFSYAIDSGRLVVVGNIPTYAHFRPKNGFEDWIFVLAKCSTREDEQKVADFYKQKVLASEVATEDRIYVVLSDQDDPEFPEEDIKEKMLCACNMDELAQRMLAQYLGKNNFEITECNYAFTDANVSDYYIHFSFLGKNFCLDFEQLDNEDTLGITLVNCYVRRTDDDSSPEKLESFENLKDYLLENHFSITEWSHHVTGDISVVNPVPRVKDKELVFEVMRGGKELAMTINPFTDKATIPEVPVENAGDAPEFPEELPESLEAKVNFIYTQMKWLKEQYSVHDEAIKRLQSK